MIKNISITCEDTKIKIDWEWADEEIEGIEIFYKKSGTSQGDGANFVNNVIMKVPYQQCGNAERQLEYENGLYVFTFIPAIKGGKKGEKIVLENVMLSVPVRVCWKVEQQREGLMITFPKLEKPLLPKSTYFQKEGYQFPLNYTIDKNTKLIICESNDERDIKIGFYEPFDKVYRAIRL